MSATTYSGYYLHDDACGLQEEGHEIREEFLDVLKAVVQESPVETEFAASGCNTCYLPDSDAWVYWVAQGDATDDVHIKYGTGDQVDMTTHALAELIVETAEEMGIDVSWNGNTSNTVVLGESDAYTNLDAGTRVARDRRRSQKTGTVLSPDMVNSDMDYSVWDQSAYDGIGAGGEKMAEFSSREAAEEWAEANLDEYNVTSNMDHGTRDGDAIVLFDGDQMPTRVKVSDLDVLE